MTAYTKIVRASDIKPDGNLHPKTYITTPVDLANGVIHNWLKREDLTKLISPNSKAIKSLREDVAKVIQSAMERGQ